MILFIIKSMLCMSFLYVIYKLFFEDSKTHQFNRFYLLGILVVSIGIPNLSIVFENATLANENMLVDLTSNTWSKYANYFFVVYIIVSLVMLYRLLNGLDSIMSKVRRYPNYDYKGNTIILIKEQQLPHSFLNYVFLNEDDYNNGKIQNELLTHEIAHIRQQHSLDIIIVELFHIVFWFNPLVYFIKKSIRLNHEFLADEVVLNEHGNRVKYQEILIAVSSNSQPMLASHINYGLTKKRFIMMASKTSKLRAIIAKLALVPIIVLSIFLFGDTSQSEEHDGAEHTTEQGHHEDGEHLN